MNFITPQLTTSFPNPINIVTSSPKLSLNIDMLDLQSVHVKLGFEIWTNPGKHAHTYDHLSNIQVDVDVLQWWVPSSHSLELSSR